MSIWLLVDLDWRSTCLKTTIFLRKNTVFVILHKYFLTNQRIQVFLVMTEAASAESIALNSTNMLASIL